MARFECNVCATKQKKSVTCPGCDYKACEKCVKRYLITTEEDKCMNCNIRWTDEFMTKILGSFLNGKKYKDHKKEIIYRRELNLLPQTQILVNREIMKENAMEQVNELKKMKERLKNEMRDLEETIRSAKMQIERGIFEEDDMMHTHRKCPSEGCKGFMKETGEVLGCKICKKKYCKKCNEEVWTEGHICDENMRKNYEEIKKRSTACPTCGIQIEKSSGCDQMWCTQCHTAFSYRRGTVETGRIHNPLYINWMREEGERRREDGDFICGGMPNVEEMHKKVYKCRNFEVKDLEYLIHGRKITGGEICKIPGANGNGLFTKIKRIFETINGIVERNENRETTELRVKYMRNKITEEVFRKGIMKIEKENKEKKVKNECMRFLQHGMIDIILDIMNGGNTIENIYREIVRLYNLKATYNKEMQKISKMYRTEGIYISARWRTISTIERRELKFKECEYAEKEEVMKEPDETYIIIRA
tara:strand:+ start:152 stop:1579 length:1428 start_codon:yes stop_codon:yes gene_type:complete